MIDEKKLIRELEFRKETVTGGNAGLKEEALLEQIIDRIKEMAKEHEIQEQAKLDGGRG